MNGTPVVCGAEPGVPTVYRSYSFDLQDRQRLYHARFIITNLQPYIACSDVSVLPGPGLRGVPNYTAIKGSVIGYVCGASATALVLLGGGTGVDLGRRAAGAAVVLGCGAMLVPGAAKGSRREVYLPGAFLGAVMGAGAALATSSDRFWNFGAYMMSMSFFHCSE